VEDMRSPSGDFFLLIAVTYKMGNGANSFFGSGSSRPAFANRAPSKKRP